MCKNVDKNIIKNLSSKCSQKLLNHVKQSAADALKIASKRAIQKTVEAPDDLIGYKKKLHQSIIQKQMKKKYLRNDLYFQN